MNVHIKLFAIALVLTSCSSTTENLLSPDGNIEIAFTLTDKGAPSYSAKYKGNDIVLPSLLGFVLKDTTSLTDNFKITGIERSDFNESWTPVWGENDTIEN